MKRTIAVMFVAGFIAITGCNNRSTGEAEESMPESTMNEIIIPMTKIRNAGIEFDLMVKRNLSEEIAARGELYVPPMSQALVPGRIGGMVEDIYVTRGSRVRKGEKLAKLTHPDIYRMQQEYLTWKGKLEYTQAEYERQAELLKDNVAARKTMEQARSEYTEAKASYEGLRLQLTMLGMDLKSIDEGRFSDAFSLVSPISGVVDEIRKVRGASLEPGEAMFRIIDRSSLMIELMVFEKDIHLVQEGQDVMFFISDVHDLQYHGKVKSIGNSVIESARVVPVVVSLDTLTSEMLPGMFVAARIMVSDDSYSTLPEEAIVTGSDARNYIFYSTNPTDSLVAFKKAPVTTGIAQMGFIQVDMPSPLPENAWIVVKGSYYVNAEMLSQEEE